jgi:hypothetical protein
MKVSRMVPECDLTPVWCQNAISRSDDDFRAAAEYRAAAGRRHRALGTHVCPASKDSDLTSWRALDTPRPRAERGDANDKQGPATYAARV